MPESKLDLLQKTAELARLELNDEQARALGPQFDAILAHFEILAAVDVEGVPPTRGATDLADVRRQDLIQESGPFEALLANAPDRQGEHYGVPKTIGEGE
jgi:aspartyl-tRNA(Asn)/glutamyl-tRNA(Gln) amidotransferase subunit C